MKTKLKAEKAAAKKRGAKPVTTPWKPVLAPVTPEVEETTKVAQESRRATISTAHAKKMLHDYLDNGRPWANCRDVYPMMEAIVEYAAFAFHGEVRPTMAELNQAHVDIMRFTEHLAEHPDDYEGPCACAECRSSGD